MKTTTVLFDFGGVVTTSPFEAFARFEEANDLPVGFIKMVNTANPNDNAWAKLERNDVSADEFAELFEREALAHGHALDGSQILPLLSGSLRPRIVNAIRKLIDSGYRVACLTNNFIAADDENALHPDPDVRAAFGLFEEVFESSRLGVRKPEPEFYRKALEALGVSPEETVFLDDLGINLKPAKAMGIRTIKVVDPDAALAELAEILGLEFG